MTIAVIGAGIGRQFINGDVESYEWRVRYRRDDGGLHHHIVSSRDAQNSQHAVEKAKRDLGQLE